MHICTENVIEYHGLEVCRECGLEMEPIYEAYNPFTSQTVIFTRKQTIVFPMHITGLSQRDLSILIDNYYKVIDGNIFRGKNRKIIIDLLYLKIRNELSRDKFTAIILHYNPDSFGFLENNKRNFFLLKTIANIYGLK